MKTDLLKQDYASLTATGKNAVGLLLSKIRRNPSAFSDADRHAAEVMERAIDKAAAAPASKPVVKPQSIKPLTTAPKASEPSKAELAAKIEATEKAARLLVLEAFGGSAAASLGKSDFSEAFEKIAFQNHCCDLLSVDPVEAGKKHYRLPLEKQRAQVGFTRDHLKQTLTKAGISFTESKDKSRW